MVACRNEGQHPHPPQQFQNMCIGGQQVETYSFKSTKIQPASNPKRVTVHVGGIVGQDLFQDTGFNGLGFRGLGFRVSGV